MTAIALLLMPIIPGTAIAEYIELRSRLLDLELRHPGISEYFRERVRFVGSEDQMLMNLHALVSNDRVAEAKSTEAIDRLSKRMPEEKAVALLAQAYADEGCIDRAIKKVLG